MLVGDVLSEITTTFHTVVIPLKVSSIYLTITPLRRSTTPDLFSTLQDNSMTRYELRLESSGDLLDIISLSGEQLLTLETKIKELREINGSNQPRIPRVKWQAGLSSLEFVRISTGVDVDAPASSEIASKRLKEIPDE